MNSNPINILFNAHELVSSAIRQKNTVKDIVDYTKRTSFKRSNTINDTNENFKSFMNKFVLMQLLQDEHNKMYFIETIASNFNALLYEYNRQKGFLNNYGKLNRQSLEVKFIYKGGNLLRVIYNGFGNIFSGNNNILSALKSSTESDFSKSDDDFTVLINPDIGNENFDIVLLEITYLTYHCLIKLRDHFEKNMTKYFSYFQYSPHKKTKILGNHLKKAIDGREFSCLTDESSPYFGYKIVGILFDDTYVPAETNSQYNNINSLVGFGGDPSTEYSNSSRLDYVLLPEKYDNALYTTNHKQKHLIFASSNDTITIPRNDDKVSSFVLNRTKINATFFLINGSNKTHVYAPGELIDVSIPRFNDMTLRHMYDHFDLYVTDYVFNFSNTHRHFKLLGYSFDYLIDDLARMLFTDTHNKPWIDKKYNKRLNRFMILGLIKSVIDNGVSNTLLGISNLHKSLKELIHCCDHIMLLNNMKDNEAARNSLLSHYDQEVEEIKTKFHKVLSVDLVDQSLILRIPNFITLVTVVKNVTNEIFNSHFNETLDNETYTIYQTFVNIVNSNIIIMRLMMLAIVETNVSDDYIRNNSNRFTQYILTTQLGGLRKYYDIY